MLEIMNKLHMMDKRSKLLLIGWSLIFLLSVIIGLCWPDDEPAANDNRCILLIGGHALGSCADDVEYYHPNAGVECNVEAIGKMSTEKIRPDTGYTSGCYLSSTQEVVIRGGARPDKGPMLYGLKDESATPLPLPIPNQYIYGSTAASIGLSKCVSCGGHNSEPLDKCYQFDPSLDPSKWTKIKSLPYKCYTAASVSLTGNDFYVMGGVESSSSTPFNKLYRFNVTNGTWHQEGSMITRRYDHAAAALSTTEFMVCGGYNTAKLSTCEIYNTVWKTWRDTGSLKYARQGLSMIRFEGDIYALGGYGAASLNTVEKYNRKTGEWETAKAMKHPRSYFVGVRV